MNVDQIVLPDEKLALIANFSKLDATELAMIISDHPELPNEYFNFLRRFGYGKLREAGEPKNFPAHFEVLMKPKSAEREYFGDTEIYQNGAKGDVLIFGLESTGIAYGFDVGNGNALVKVDNYRLVTNLHLNFPEFIFGLLACYPDLPEKYEDGYWFNDIEERFSIHGLS